MVVNLCSEQQREEPCRAVTMETKARTRPACACLAGDADCWAAQVMQLPGREAPAGAAR